MAHPLEIIPITSGTWDDVPGTALIPTNIHLDLQREGLIPDPHHGMAEADVQWVHDKPWTFRTTFVVPALASHAPIKAVLVFEGLDTFAAVSVDGENVLVSENMFLSHRVDVTNFGAGEHTLVIVFDSAMQRGDALLRQYGERVCWNGHYSRVYVRKAQYHYGWDWGPSLVTCGPWKPIRLEVYESRISDVSAVVEVAEDLGTARVVITAEVEGEVGGRQVEVSIIGPNGKTKTRNLVDGMAMVDIKEPELWFPRGYGKQNLYTVSFTLGGVHTITKKIGLRRVELIQDPLPEEPGNEVSGGSTFYFRINNTDVFCGGSNWIPGDSFQPRFTRDKLSVWLSDLLAQRGNQIMVRIWGGGIYESEDFYDICDETGILVWQDVATACADYPAHLDWFADSILKELHENLSRIRWHPSLVIVAGNNEDYQVADEEVGYGSHDHTRWREEPFPSRWLYEKEYPEIVHKLCNNSSGPLIGAAGTHSSGVVYWPGSPFSGMDATDRTVGDLHQWNVWGGLQAPYQRYPDLGGRFISEFGMIAHPANATIQEGFLDPSKPTDDRTDDLHPQSEVMRFHMKAHSFEKRIIPYIHENFRIMTASLDEMIYLTQLVQSESLSHAYRGWRARWGSSPTDRECGGALVWQMNDLWPATSWAIVDFFQRPKMGFYSIARALRPHTLIIRRTTNDPKPNPKVEALVTHKSAIRCGGAAKLHSTPHIYPPKKSTATVRLSSIAPTAPDAPLHVLVRLIAIPTGASTTVLDTTVRSSPNTTQTLLHDVAVPEDVPTVVHATLTHTGTRRVLSRDTDWPTPLKFVNFTPAHAPHVTNTARGVSVAAELPCKAVWIEERGGTRWGDNGVDVVPGDVYDIDVDGLQEGGEGVVVGWWYGKKG